jgi:acetyltransferase
MNHKEQFITFPSQNGHLISVRPLQFEDTPHLVDIFENMTAESRYRRFHQTTDGVSATRVQKEAADIAQADPQRNWGLIAFADLPGQKHVPIGAVRLVRTKPNEAEVAISIRDDFQKLGIGTRLMHMLAEAAQEMGLNRLVADIQNDNAAIWHVFNSLPYHVLRQPEGVYSNIVISLTSPRDVPGSNSRG